MAVAAGAELAELACEVSDAVGLGIDEVDADADADADAETEGGEGTVTLRPHACANWSNPPAIAGSNVWTQFAHVVNGPAPTPT